MQPHSYSARKCRKRRIRKTSTATCQCALLNLALQSFKNQPRTCARVRTLSDKATGVASGLVSCGVQNQQARPACVRNLCASIAVACEENINWLGEISASCLEIHQRLGFCQFSIFFPVICCQDPEDGFRFRALVGMHMGLECRKANP